MTIKNTRNVNRKIKSDATVLDDIWMYFLYTFPSIVIAVILIHQNILWHRHREQLLTKILNLKKILSSIFLYMIDYLSSEKGYVINYVVLTIKLFLPPSHLSILNDITVRYRCNE